ncbi:MAG: undecaprenyl-diphosphate phosphatase [Chloroflexi bacterium]|nr:undecaprenyl-diphosphate phosphatase [Chloroflexota bacterium]
MIKWYLLVMLLFVTSRPLLILLSFLSLYTFLHQVFQDRRKALFMLCLWSAVLLATLQADGAGSDLITRIVQDKFLGWFVVVATIPAVIAGLLIKPYITQIYTMYILISIVLMLGGILMLTAERFGRRTRDLKQLSWLDSIIVGTWQVLALIPGVSRSSATISGAMLRNFTREDAARFSFLMSIPALLGAGVVASKDLFEVPGLLASIAGPLVVGFLAAAISGYLSIRWLLGYLKTRSLRVFIVYRFVFGGFCLAVGLFRLFTQ